RFGSAINLNWTDNSPDEDGFVIERATATGAFTEVFRTAPNRTTYRSATKHGSYTYRIRTLRAGLLSTPSNAVQLSR
ncbi:MAG: hypothetical protein ACRD43_15635, partial [Pyrinomonadaceae bacterium]